MNSTIGLNGTETFKLKRWQGVCTVQYCEGFSLKTIDISVAVAVCSLVTVGGSLGNTVIILVIRRTANIKTVCGVLIANLAIADLLVTAIAVPMVISGITVGVIPQCLASITSSLVFIVIGRYSTTASLLTLVAMSIDRCWAISSPLSHRLKMNSSKLKLVLVFIWLSSPILPALEVFLCEQRPILVRLEVAGCTICYAAIVMSGLITFINVRYRSSKIRNLHEDRGKRKIAADLRERNKQVAKTIALIVLLFSVCWVPILSIAATIPDRYTRLHFWFGILGLANSAVNPCIYFYRQRNYRQAFKQLVLPAFNSR